MNRDFVGMCHDEIDDCDVHIEHEGKSQSLTHMVRGLNVEYEWDRGGPASTDLARALLWEATGVEPEWRTYRLFKNEVVATWPRRKGECWRISDEQIRQWLAGVERDTAGAEDASQTEARLGQLRGRELKLKSFARMFTRKASD